MRSYLDWTQITQPYLWHLICVGHYLFRPICEILSGLDTSYSALSVASDLCSTDYLWNLIGVGYYLLSSICEV